MTPRQGVDLAGVGVPRASAALQDHHRPLPRGEGGPHEDESVQVVVPVHEVTRFPAHDAAVLGEHVEQLGGGAQELMAARNWKRKASTVATAQIPANR